MMFYYIFSQVEILGVSLPWRGVFSNEGPGARITELAKKTHEESNLFLSSTETNPFSSASLSNDITPSIQKSDSTNWLDLLTGDDMFSDPLSQPVMQYDVHEGSDNMFSHPLSQTVTQNNLHEENDLLGFLDQAVTEHRGTVADDKLSSSQDSSAQKYINCLKLFAGPQMVCCCSCFLSFAMFLHPSFLFKNFLLSVDHFFFGLIKCLVCSFYVGVVVATFSISSYPVKKFRRT
jgi:hypothetical protein